MPIDNLSSLLRPVRFGLILSILTILFGFGLGIAFGLAEDSIKDHFKARAQAAEATAYTLADGSFDQTRFSVVTAQSWFYIKRAHLHANGIGTAALAMCLLLSLATRTRPSFRAIAAFLLGIGALGYALFWLLAALKAPTLGSTHEAKEALKWLAMPTSGAAVTGAVLTFLFLLRTAFCRCAKAMLTTSGQQTITRPL